MRRAVLTALGAVTLLGAALPAIAAPTAGRGHVATHGALASTSRDGSHLHGATVLPRAARSAGGALSPTGLWSTPAPSTGARPVHWDDFVAMVKQRKAALNETPPRSVTFEVVFTGYLVVPDLDGDGKPDMARATARSSSAGDSTEVTAFRGSDGHVLWRYTSTTFDFPVPARVGPKAVNGFYLLSFSFTDATAGYVGTLGVTALNGAGKPVWSKTYRGLGGGVLVADAGQLPDPTWVASMSGDNADDLLLVTETDAYSLLDDRHAAQIEVLSGADGSTVSKVGPLVTMSGFDLPVAAGDLSGDKRADIVAVEFDPASQIGKLSAFRGTDGSRLWTTKPDYYEAFPGTVGDMNGDGRADVLVATAGYKLRLLNGATGATLWTRSEGQVLDLGDIGRDHREDIAVLSYSNSGSGLQMTISAVDGAGSTRWSHTVRSNHSGAQVYAWYAGDFQADGVQDLMVVDDFRNQSGDSRHHYFLDGRTGRVLRDHLAKGEYGAGGAIDGHGDDILVGTITKSDRALVTARRGEDGRKLWVWNGPAGSDPPEGFAYDLTGDRRADVILFAGGFEKGSLTMTILDGRTGKLRWRA